MCASCGCGEVNENHGNQANITKDQIDRAAEAAQLTPAQVAENIASAVQ